MSGSVLVGIDVSSQTLKVACSSEAKTWQVANDAAGIEQLTHTLVDLKPALVVFGSRRRLRVRSRLRAAGCRPGRGQPPP